MILQLQDLCNVAILKPLETFCNRQSINGYVPILGRLATQVQASSQLSFKALSILNAAVGFGQRYCGLFADVCFLNITP
jgi:hypothetical protein